MMKSTIFTYITMLSFLLCITSCEDLTEVNTNPNAVDGASINSKYVFASILANTPNSYTREFVYGRSSGIAEATQYLQRDYIGFQLNNLIWSDFSFSVAQYKPLKDSDYLFAKAESEQNEASRKFYQATALIMKSFYYGHYAAMWGDLPYSEAMRAEEGLFTPVYDQQKEVLAAVINDLKLANEMLKDVGLIGELSSIDILYEGDALKWRKFANSLRLRLYMLLSEKRSDFSIDVAAEFHQILQDPNANPIFESNADNATIAYGGTESSNSWPGGPLGWSNRSEYYRRKPASPLVRQLRETGDPRLTVWLRPADAQILVRSSSDEYGIGIDGRVKRYISSYEEGIDTFLYVGLDVAMKEPDSWNLRESSNYAAIKSLNSSLYLEQGANPHTSYLADMYAENANPLVESILMTYSEVNFLLAEANLREWTSTDDVEILMSKGIASSLDQFGISDGSRSVYNTTSHTLDPFDQVTFINGFVTELNNAADQEAKLEVLLTQKWLALWMTPEGYLNWRRTGIPNLAANVLSGTNGDKIPVRLIYGNNEMNLNGANVMQAVSNLSPAENTQWSKTWLSDGTGKPW